MTDYTPHPNASEWEAMRAHWRRMFPGMARLSDELIRSGLTNALRESPDKNEGKKDAIPLAD